jgi:hypothetical protein
MPKIIKVAIVFLAIFTVAMIIIAGVRFLGGDEDGWLCTNGQWIKHGNPSSSKPTSGCSVEKSKSIVNQYNQDQEAKYPETKIDDIKIASPKENELVKSPLTITGEARGNWFFEANFPITILDDRGNTIGSAIAEAQGDWMTENFVPFKATLRFSSGTSDIGFLILRNDDPSGDVSKQKSVIINIRFK